MTGPILMSPADFRRLLREGKPFLIEFYSPTCPHCAALEPVIEALAGEWGKQIPIGQIDILEHSRMAQDWTVMGTPTVIIFSEGQEVARLTGVQAYRQYDQALKQLMPAD